MTAGAAILWPMVAQAALTAAVWFWMYVVRIGEMRRRGIDPQSLALRRQVAGALERTAPADNLNNLTEIPTLFFAACLAIAVLGQPSPLQLGLAWAFVALRVVHSLVHLTYNRVVHRFAAYVLATLACWALWATLAAQLLAG